MVRWRPESEPTNVRGKTSPAAAAIFLVRGETTIGIGIEIGGRPIRGNETTRAKRSQSSAAHTRYARNSGMTLVPNVSTPSSMGVKRVSMQSRPIAS